jgi:hypothetical protein
LEGAPRAQESFAAQRAVARARAQARAQARARARREQAAVADPPSSQTARLAVRWQAWPAARTHHLLLRAVARGVALVDGALRVDDARLDGGQLFAHGDEELLEGHVLLAQRVHVHAQVRVARLGLVELHLRHGALLGRLADLAVDNLLRAEHGLARAELLAGRLVVRGLAHLHEERIVLAEPLLLLERLRLGRLDLLLQLGLNLLVVRDLRQQPELLHLEALRD